MVGVKFLILILLTHGFASCQTAPTQLQETTANTQAQPLVAVVYAAPG
jgi:starvation-inducible outer membrane lipoprotein